MKKQSNAQKFLSFLMFAVAGLWLAPTDAQAGHWNVFFDLRPTVLDGGQTGPTAGCGTMFVNTDTPLGAGNFSRCAGGVPGGGVDARSGDANHIVHTSVTFNAGKGPSGGEYTLPAWAWNGGMVLRFNDADGNGVPANGEAVSLIWFSNEQHTRTANIPLYGGDVRVHMHTRAVMADAPSAVNCPATIGAVAPQGAHAVTCMGSYTPATYQANGTWNTASNRIDWSATILSGTAPNAIYSGQMRNTHNFGYVDCTSSANGCSQGSLSVGLNWKEGYTNWNVRKIQGGNVNSGPLSAFNFTGTVNFSTATSSLYFSTASDLLADSANSGGTHNSWWRLKGVFNQALYVPEPGTALLVLGGLIGLVASRRRQS